MSNRIDLTPRFSHISTPHTCSCSFKTHKQQTNCRLVGEFVHVKYQQTPALMSLNIVVITQPY